MKTKTPSKVPVTRRALIQRANRALAKEGRLLRAYRGGRPDAWLGELFIVDTSRNIPVEGDVDLEKLAKELGVLKPFEKLAD